MKIYLIRHGRTTANEEKRYSGKQDVKLSESGKKELFSIKQELSHINGLPSFISTLSRTRQTKEILLPDSEVIDQLSFMNETDFGDFEGKTYSDLKHDKNYNNWLSNITENKPRNGESFSSFKERVVPAFKEHIMKQETDTVYVTHGGVIRIIMSEIADKKVPFFNWEIPNGKGYILIVENKEVVSYQKI